MSPVLARIICVAALIGLIPLSPANVLAGPGNFWYGLYNVSETGPWVDSIWTAMRETYKMNWALLGISEAQHAAGVLNRAQAEGINVMQWAPHEGGLEFQGDSALVFKKYGASNFLRLQAEGDSLGWYWEVHPHPECGEVTMGTFVRLSTPGNGTGPVYDSTAHRDSSWLFMPHESRPKDSIWALVYGDLNRYPSTRGSNTFSVNVRSGDECSGTLLHFYVGRFTSFCQNPIAWDIVDSTIVDCDSLVGGAWHPFSITLDSKFNDGLIFMLKWTGKARVWVDWFQVGDEPGIAIGTADADANSLIRNYIDRYSFGGKSAGILGFYMHGELWEEANVIPQHCLDTLVQGRNDSLTVFSEHHYVKWWPDRNMYGERQSASARIPGSSMPVHGQFYPYSGYGMTEPESAPEPLSGRQFDTVLAVLPDTGTQCFAGGDTAVCLQEAVDSLAYKLAVYKGLADSTGKVFVPHLQAFTLVERAIDTLLNDPTPPWKMTWRPPLENEVKLEASIALANGAQGLIYYLYAQDTVVTVPKQKYNCDSGFGSCDTAYNWLIQKDRAGFAQLPEVQAALHHFVGPLIDSIGEIFYSLQWRGASRVDPVPEFDTGAVHALFDSVRSLTLAPETPAYVHAGVFEFAAEDYFLLVNRRAYDTVDQIVRSWLNLPAGLFYVVNMYNCDSVLTGSLPGGEIQFTTTLPPGESKLFKIVPVDSTPVAAAAVPEQVEGNVSITGTVTIDSNRSLTIYGPSEILMTAGDGYRFEAHGPMTVVGTESSPVVIRSSNTSSPGRQDWAGIWHYGPGDVSLKNVCISDCYRGLWVLDVSSTDVIDIDSCEFKHGYYAGIENDRDTSTLVSIKHTRIADFSNHGIYIYKGRTDIDSCLFRETLAYGIRYEAGNSNSRPISGQVRYCSFDSLTSSNAIGVYLSSIKSNQTPSGVILLSNTFGGQWLGSTPNAQTAIYVYNCDAELTLLNNRIDGEGSAGSFRPAYGILNYSTKTHIIGDYFETLEPSIDRAKNGIYSFSSGSSDPNYAFVRKTRIESGQNCVYVYSNSKIDLTGTAPCDTINAILRLVSEGGYNVYNNSSFEIPAETTYWGCPGCVDSVAVFVGPIDVLPAWIHGRQAPPEEWCGGSPKLTTSPVSDVAVSSLPTNHSENYPNPFNSSTVIRFTLTTAGEVQLQVYNVLGQLVRRLVNQPLEAGSHLANWDGLDDSGNQLASGVYFYRLTTNDLQITRKMVIMK